MFRSIQSNTRPGLHINEDAVWGQEDFLFVIDAATGLSNHLYMSLESDAHWFAAQTARLLCQLLPDKCLSIPAILHIAMENIQNQWLGPESAMPTAGIAIWRCHNDSLELLNLGDCGASVEFTDGHIAVWQERNLTRLDTSVLNQMVLHCRDNGCTMEEARRWAAPLLRENRALHNKPGGYWILDPSGVGIDHARTATLPLSECHSVCAYSDGFAQLCQFMPGLDEAVLHRMLLTHGVYELMDFLYEKQEQDKEMLFVPRFKLRDDTTAIAAQIKLQTAQREGKGGGMV